MPYDDTGLTGIANPDYRWWFEQNMRQVLVLEPNTKPNLKIMPHLPTRYYISGQLGGTGNGIPVTRKDRT